MVCSWFSASTARQSSASRIDTDSRVVVSSDFGSKRGCAIQQRESAAAQLASSAVAVTKQSGQDTQHEVSSVSLAHSHCRLAYIRIGDGERVLRVEPDTRVDFVENRRAAADTRDRNARHGVANRVRLFGAERARTDCQQR